MNKIKRNTILVLAAAIVAMASLVITGCKKSETTTAESQKYTCEMHPEIVQDKPGDCPKCHMKLTAKR